MFRSDQDDSPLTNLSLDDQSSFPFKNALHTAIEYGSVDVVRTLLENGIDPNACGQIWPDGDEHRHSSSSSTPVLNDQCNFTSDGKQVTTKEGIKHGQQTISKHSEHIGNSQ